VVQSPVLRPNIHLATRKSPLPFEERAVSLSCSQEAPLFSVLQEMSSILLPFDIPERCETLYIMFLYSVMISETPAQTPSVCAPTVGCPQHLYTRPPYMQLSDHGVCCLWGASWSCLYSLYDFQCWKQPTRHLYNISVVHPRCCGKESQLRICLLCVRKQLNCGLEKFLCLRIWLVDLHLSGLIVTPSHPDGRV